jgi:type II secretory pathway component PulJ
MNARVQTPNIDPGEFAVLRPVVDAAQVAWMLNIRPATFHNKRAALERNGFPRKLPGLNGWSRNAVLCWINGHSASDAGPHGEHVEPRNYLEQRYGQ